MEILATAADWAAPLLAALGRASLHGAAAITGLWLVCRLFPRLPAGLRCGLWWLACLKLLVALVWVEPVAPNLALFDARVRSKRRSLVNWVVTMLILGSIAVVATALVANNAKHSDGTKVNAGHATSVAITWSVWVSLAVAVLATLPLIVALVRRSRERTRWEQWRTEAHEKFLASHQTWAAAHDEHFRPGG